MTPEFTDWLESIASASGYTSAEVAAMWQEYCRECRNYDQSPVESEFCRWYKLTEATLASVLT